MLICNAVLMGVCSGKYKSKIPFSKVTNCWVCQHSFPHTEEKCRSELLKEHYKISYRRCCKKLGQDVECVEI